ncbi:MAG: iron-sulfur cluster-binding protein [Gammaproteobacteria bacterium]|nr:iron-sulfur cluster-binding protein [Gammaproteobacteria bacterium]MCP5425060.1 iron-sulfur cluster-binding protein [Gammaproteobacteria bacterium]MCP5459763.1 iron-sulfur cluster-binding protein [Gammaproteobacteria bacterium]
MAETGAVDFQSNVVRALADRQLRGNLKKAMGSLSLKRKAVFSDPEEFEHLRRVGNAIRRRSLSKLPVLLEQLEKNCTANGIQVHWAETTADANQIFLDIIKGHDASRVIKGKSMVSEEMHLNHFLEDHSIEALETDLGEYIIQLDHETPSHIIVPAIHKNKDQIAHLFHEKIPNTPYTEVVEELNAIARKTLRQKFFAGEIGVSGVNFAVAETGTLCLVENEGNGRMCTTVPPVHIAVMGLEKVVEHLSDVPPLLRLLTGSATGQVITTYFNMITSPRKAGEKDGPKEVHLVILDNGRSKILADPQLRETLQCIRCGACLNHCPVYTRLGGHAYGYVYPGPIGSILTPQMEGLHKAGAMASASSLCGACEEVCPVKIPFTSLLRILRDESYAEGDSPHDVDGHGYKRHFTESLAWKGWAVMNTNPTLNHLSTKMLGMVGAFLPKAGPLKHWTQVRTTPKFAKQSLHALAKARGLDDE